MFIVSVVSGEDRGSIFKAVSVDVASIDDFHCADGDSILSDALNIAKKRSLSRMIRWIDENEYPVKNYMPIGEETRVYVMNGSGETVAKY